MPRRFSFKGYYKGWFFRSLKELSFVLLCEENGQKWQSAETEELSVTYTDVYGKKRKHFADLLVDKHIIVEIKPKAYQKSKTVKLKSQAMQQFCNKNGYHYMVVSPKIVPIAKLKELVDKNEILISEELQTKFSKYIKNRLSRTTLS